MILQILLQKDSPQNHHQNRLNKEEGYCNLYGLRLLPMPARTCDNHKSNTHLWPRLQTKTRQVFQ